MAKMGKAVVLLEALDRVLSRVVGTALSAFFEHTHRAQGVDVRVGAKVDCLLGEERVKGVRPGDQTVLSADLVVIGIGIVPAVAPPLAAGADGGNGVAVDAVRDDVHGRILVEGGVRVDPAALANIAIPLKNPV